MMTATMQKVDDDAEENNEEEDGKKTSTAAKTDSSSISSSSETPNTFPWSNVRLYDFGERHAALAPEQCDVVHGMCIFLPARKAHVVASVVALFGGAMCPGVNGTCQDMGNFKLLDDVLTAVKV